MEMIVKSAILLVSGWLMLEVIRLPDGLHDALLFIGRTATRNSQWIKVNQAVNILRLIIVIVCILAFSYAGREIIF